MYGLHRNELIDHAGVRPGQRVRSICKLLALLSPCALTGRLRESHEVYTPCCSPKVATGMHMSGPLSPRRVHCDR